MVKFLAVALLLGASARAADLTVITHDSFDLDKKLVAQFERANGAKVHLIKGGDAGALLNKLILTRAVPIADVVYGLDNTSLGKARAAGILAPYTSPESANVPAEYRLPGNLLSAVDYGYVALNADKAYFEKHKLALPKTLEDLTQPAYKNLLVVENPATSSPGLAFLMATVNHFGAGQVWNWWRDLRANGLRVANGWEGAYDTDFSLNGGKYPIVVSYATSPAAEVFYSKTKLKDSPTANVFLPGSTFLQVEGVGLLRGGKQPELARKFVDFMLSRAVQADFPTRMWVYPARAGVKLDPVFKFAQLPPQSAQLSPDQIAGGAQKWTDRWTAVVLRGEK